MFCVATGDEEEPEPVGLDDVVPVMLREEGIVEVFPGVNVPIELAVPLMMVDGVVVLIEIVDAALEAGGVSNST